MSDPKITFCIPQNCAYVQPHEIEAARVEVRPCRYPVLDENFLVTVLGKHNNSFAYVYANTEEDANAVAMVIKDMLHLWIGGR
jgi:hypothetical protein